VHFGLWDSSLNVNAYICCLFQATNKKIVKADAYVAGLWFVLPLSVFININLFSSGEYSKPRTILLMAACDVPGIKRLLPTQWRELEFFNNIYELVGVPVVTVQLRYNGWVTELQDLERSR
jgi:uncharacterized protein with NAD-binding domain and iron-sulfur cluster